MPNRLENFLATLRWMRPLAGGIAPALLAMLRRRRDPLAEQVFSYKGRPLHFRGVDGGALKEVLVDEEYAFLRPYLQAKSNPIILDVGSHIGTFAMWALTVNPSSRILGVEADPDTYRLAIRNSDSFGPASWSVLNNAAAARDGVTVRFSTDGPSMSHKVSTTGTRSIETITLGTLAQKIASGARQIDIVKVDIEGSEEEFLCSDPSLLARVDCLVVELHPLSCDVARVLRDVQKHFDIVVEVGGRQSTKPLLHCQRTSLLGAEQ